MSSPDNEGKRSGGVEGTTQVPEAGNVVNPEAEAKARAYQQVLEQLRDVIAARLEVGEEGRIRAIRVLARTGRHPRQIIRDVQSAMLGRFQVEVGAEAVSVAQLAEDMEAEVAPVRLRLNGVTLQVRSGVIVAEVELHIHGTAVTGSAGGPATTVNRNRLAVHAALAAIHTYLGRRLFEVVEASVVRLGGRKLALVLLTWLGKEGDTTYVGCCQVRLDQAEAMVRATLDALNRHLAWLS